MMRYNKLSEAKKHGHSQEQLPIVREDVRQLTLDAAGFDPQTAGAWLRRAAEKMVEKLDATKTQFFAHEGEIISRVEIIDHATQLKAAEDLSSLGIDVMGLRRRSTDDRPAPPQINIDLSGWSVNTPEQDEPKNVSPRDRESDLD